MAGSIITSAGKLYILLSDPINRIYLGYSCQPRLNGKQQNKLQQIAVTHSCILCFANRYYRAEQQY